MNKKTKKHDNPRVLEETITGDPKIDIRKHFWGSFLHQQQIVNLLCGLLRYNKYAKDYHDISIFTIN